MSFIAKRNYTEVDLSTRIGVAGRYMFVAHKADGSSRVLADWFPNLILDSGLIGMGAANYLSTCSVGTGTSEPNAAQTSLDNLLVSTATINSFTEGVVTSPEPRYGWLRRVYRFEAGVAAGNISEVGVGWSAVGLVSRSLIRDPEGVPTSITVLPDEFLDVIYEFRLYPNTIDSSFTIESGGVTYACVSRPIGTGDNARWGGGTNQNVGNEIGYRVLAIAPRDSFSYQLVDVYNTGLQAHTANPTTSYSGATSSADTIVQHTYNNNSVAQASAHYGLNKGNLSGGIAMFIFQSRGMGCHQISFNPPIMKTGVHTLILNASVGWGRYPA